MTFPIFPIFIFLFFTRNRGVCNSFNCLGHFKHVCDDDNDDDGDDVALTPKEMSQDSVACLFRADHESSGRVRTRRW